jgi:hypothetical protein
MNGGPGSDSILGLLDELGPCRITENLTTTINPWSFSNVSNLLFLSQPVGVGFSYQEVMEGTPHNITGAILTPEMTPKDSPSVVGRYSALNVTIDHPIDTSDAAAIAGWDIVQGFISGVESLGGKAKKPKKFNIWAESYGGHWYVIISSVGDGSELTRYHEGVQHSSTSSTSRTNASPTALSMATLSSSARLVLSIPSWTPSFKTLGDLNTR